MPETSPSPNLNVPFVPSSPLTSKDITPPSGETAELATVTDINKFREGKESRAGRPPAAPARSMDIKKRDTSVPPSPDEAPPLATLPPSPLASVTTPDTADTGRADISDLVNIDSKGRGHEPSQNNISGNKSGGQFISEDNMDTIADNADFIRNNLPGSEPTPEEPTPETPDGPDGPDGPESRGDRAVRNLDDSIVAFARARIALERILGGKNQEAYDVAEANLHLAYNEYIANLSEEVAEGNRELNTRVEALGAGIDSISDQISATEDAIASAAPDADIAQMYANIAAHEARQQELESRRSELQSQIEASEVRNNEIIAQRVAEVSARVDSEMLAQRERAHPRLTKINEWLRTHTKTRIVVGVALAASGFVGVVTGNVPLVVGSIAARAALSGYGGYNAARGFGERRADKRFNAADTSSIEDYTAAAGNQSRTRRRSKKTGAVIGGAMAAVPIIRGIANAGDVVTPPKPQAPVPETPIPAPPTNIPNLTPTDFRFPWTHMTDQIGSNGTPRIMEIANNAPKLGWQVIGNGQGGGSGAILRIIDPVGKVYEGNGPINAALDYLGTQTP